MGCLGEAARFELGMDGWDRHFRDRIRVRQGQPHLNWGLGVKA